MDKVIATEGCPVRHPFVSVRDVGGSTLMIALWRQRYDTEWSITVTRDEAQLVARALIGALAYRESEAAK